MNLLELFLKKNSGEIARNRLKLLLVSERAGCSPELLEMIKNDLIRVVSRYMEAVSYTHLIACVEQEKVSVKTLKKNLFSAF